MLRQHDIISGYTKFPEMNKIITRIVGEKISITFNV